MNSDIYWLFISQQHLQFKISKFQVTWTYWKSKHFYFLKQGHLNIISKFSYNKIRCTILEIINSIQRKIWVLLINYYWMGSLIVVWLYKTWFFPFTISTFIKLHKSLLKKFWYVNQILHRGQYFYTLLKIPLNSNIFLRNILQFEKMKTNFLAPSLNQKKEGCMKNSP